MSWTGAGIGAAIGTLFGGPIGAGVGAAIGGMIGNDEETSTEEYKELKLKVKQKQLELEDGSSGEFFVLHIKGDIEVPHNDYEVKTIIQIFDITDDADGKAVYTNEEAYNDKDDGTFYIENKTSIPYEVSTFDIDIEQILIDGLILPRKGERKLFFLYTIVDDKTGTEIAALIKKKKYHNLTDGYEDMQEYMPIIEELSIQMAFYMSSIDGNIDTEEGKVVSDLGKRILEIDYADEQEKNKKRINGYISTAYRDAKNKQLNIQELMNKANEICTIDIKYLMFDACLDVAAADGVADKTELELAHYMGKKLELDKNEYTKMIEKKLPINIHNEEDLEDTFEKNLGITPSMSHQEIGEVLKKEFKKWNQRVAHSDASKREQAEIMVHKISELRKKYKN